MWLWECRKCAGQDAPGEAAETAPGLGALEVNASM